MSFFTYVAVYISLSSYCCYFQILLYVFIKTLLLDFSELLSAHRQDIGYVEANVHFKLMLIGRRKRSCMNTLE